MLPSTRVVELKKSSVIVDRENASAGFSTEISFDVCILVDRSITSLCLSLSLFVSVLLLDAKLLHVLLLLADLRPRHGIDLSLPNEAVVYEPGRDDSLSQAVSSSDRFGF